MALRPSRQLRTPKVSHLPSPSADKPKPRLEESVFAPMARGTTTTNMPPTAFNLPPDMDPSEFRMLPLHPRHRFLTRIGVLDRAKEITTGDRQRDYGSIEKSFRNTAKMWSVILGHKVSPEQFALMMIALKMNRVMNDPTKADSWIDIAGYSALGAEIAAAYEEDK